MIKIKQAKTLFLFFSVVLLLLVLYIPFPTATAAVQGTHALSVKAILPPNQLRMRNTYFDLQLGRGESQTIQIWVENSAPQTVIADLALNPARTDENAQIIYHLKTPDDAGAKINILDVAKLRTSQIELPPESGAFVDIDLTMPNVRQDGVILGGILVKARALEGEMQNAGIHITHDIEHIIGLKITQDPTLITGQNMNLTGLRHTKEGKQDVLLIDLQNDRPRIMQDVTLTALLFKNGDAQPFKSKVTEAGSIAPNSAFAYRIDFGKEPLEDGEYTLDMTVISGEDRWHWRQTFTVDENGLEVPEPERAYFIYLWLLVIPCVLALTLVILLWKHRKKKEETTRHDEDTDQHA